MAKYQSINELFNAFVGREITVIERRVTYKLGNSDAHGVARTLVNSSIVKEMQETALSRGFTDVVINLPGALKIGNTPKINGSSKRFVVVDVAQDKNGGAYRVAGYTLK